jgi:hypothetical protein
MEITRTKLHPVFYVLTFAGILVMSAIINQTMNKKAPEIESPQVIRGIIKVFKSIDNH